MSDQTRIYTMDVFHVDITERVVASMDRDTLRAAVHAKMPPHSLIGPLWIEKGQALYRAALGVHPDDEQAVQEWLDRPGPVNEHLTVLARPEPLIYSGIPPHERSVMRR